MYSKHPQIPLDVDPATRIWRFMTLEKFLFLLERNALFFSRGNLLGDSFEGSVPMGNRLQRLLTGSARWMITASDMTGDGRDLVYVNSWHMNQVEPSTMWGTYAHGGTGIAVQSTLLRLQRALDSATEEVFIGKVQYGDYDSAEFFFPEGNVFFPFLYKRSNFAGERELRALYMINPTEYPITHTPPDQSGPGKFMSPLGIAISVNLETLIERVFASPTTEPWVGPVLESLIRKYHVSACVLPSELGSKSPAF